MTDEEFLFHQTEIERKKLGYGDKHKKRGGGRYVRLPSDRLSKKEWEKMNGEIKTYKKKDFYTWEEFKALPSDLQVAWVNSIINRYEVGLTVISQDILGMSRNALHQHFKANGEKPFINKPQTGAAASRGRKKLAAAFDLWKNTQITMSDEMPAAPEAVAAEPEEIGEDPRATEKPDLLREAEEIPLVKLPSFDAANIAALIAALAGSGAKLTIEVTL